MNEYILKNIDLYYFDPIRASFSTDRQVGLWERMPSFQTSFKEQQQKKVKKLQYLQQSTSTTPISQNPLWDSPWVILTSHNPVCVRPFLLSPISPPTSAPSLLQKARTATGCEKWDGRGRWWGHKDILNNNKSLNFFQSARYRVLRPTRPFSTRTAPPTEVLAPSRWSSRRPSRRWPMSRLLSGWRDTLSLSHSGGRGYRKRAGSGLIDSRRRC